MIQSVLNSTASISAITIRAEKKGNVVMAVDISKAENHLNLWIEVRRCLGLIERLGVEHHFVNVWFNIKSKS